MMRATFLAAAFLFIVAFLGMAKAEAPVAPETPLPDIVALMREVEAHQKATEGLERNYLFHSLAREETFDSHGNLKKTESEDSEIFYVAGIRIRRLLKKGGRDLSPDEQARESRRIDKEIGKAKEDQQKGKQQDHDRDEVTVSRFLALGNFTNARRVQLSGRDTIAIDFTGNPQARTESRFEGAIREMEGTVWIDEEDRSLRKLEGHFMHDFKVGGGLLADVKQGTAFGAEWTKVNGEVWLPVAFSGRGDIRVLLFVSIHGSLQVTLSGYRKFKTTATIVPISPDPQGP